MRRSHAIITFAVVFVLGFGMRALSNYQITPGGPTTIFSINATNQGTSLCAAASTECPSHVPINTAGAPMFTAAVPGVISTAVNVTPVDCSVTLMTGGTAQNAFTGQAAVHGFTVANIDAATGSGEPVWISWTGAAAAGAVGSYPLQAPTATSFASAGSFTSPPGMGITALSVVAATGSHKISCTRW